VKSDEVEFVADMARAGAGLSIDKEKLYLIESRLAPVARREGFGSIREMLITARQRREGKLMWAVVEAMAAGETCFFRDREVFERFGREMLPDVARARRGEPVRIWSAGCGSGQEAYSLAFAVEEASGAVQLPDVDIMGSDLSERAMEKARSGLYTQFEVQRGLPIRVLVSWFEKQDELWELSPRIRAMVHWKRVNMNADFRALGRFDVIFCRNVLMGMEPEARARALQQLVSALEPSGYLVLGAQEEPEGLEKAFVPMSGGVFQPDPAFSAEAA
jgi:chemotaxis protein methyltransferase CheR